MATTPVDVDGTSADHPDRADGLPPRIFIVYENHEQQFVRALKDLLDSWGFDAFFCRQEVRELATAQPYRTELAEQLASAELVVLILSNGFQYSQYCQAEAGATVTYKKRQIQILIPPVTRDEVSRISPVLEGWELIDGSKPQELVAELRNKLAGAFGNRGLPQAKGFQATLKREEAVQSALVEVIEAYRIEPPAQALIGVWSSLTDERTGKSVIAHIRRALAEGATNLAVVGVSLKYSINIIGEALNNLSSDAHPSRLPKGPLTIELVHVDDQSHILHSLKDNIDIESVEYYFRAGWPLTKADWESKCREAGIEVNVADPIAIDYIPQQVGIRVKSVAGEWSVLYAGRCSFEHAGVGTRLLVGEGEYFFYTSPARDARGPKAIDIFNQYFRQYRSPKHNGATLVLDHIEWIGRLESCVVNCADVRELVIVSNTTQKLFPLIVAALGRGLSVRVYTRHPDQLAPWDAEIARSLEERLAGEIDSRLGPECPGRVELRYFRHTPTFRAAVIGESVLGFQAYQIQAAAQDRSGNHPERGTETISPSELRLIVTRHGEHFQKLRKMVDLQCLGADAAPFAVLGRR